MITAFLHRFFGRPEGVKGCYLLRNYKRTHRARVLAAIERGELNGAIIIRDVAYGPAGIIPHKIAVFCRNEMPAAEPLFFQFYSIVKEEEKRREASSVRLPSALQS